MGRGRAVGAGLGVGVCLGVDVAVGVGVAVAVAVGVGEADEQGLIGQLKNSVVAMIVAPSLAYPPAFQILLVPSVSAAKLRPAVGNGVPIDHVLLAGS